MFTPEERDHLRTHLLEFAANDERISGAAITGSASGGAQDRWSDVDLAFGVSDADELARVLSDWTAHMYKDWNALHHFDVRFGAWTYRVFLLADTLQVDLAFVPAAEFRALAPTFKLIFGNANEPRHTPPQEAGDIIGLAWLHALHARSCIARHKFWQAECMISGIRDSALALACMRHGLPTVHGKGFDQLPQETVAQFEGSLVRSLESPELCRAFKAVVEGFLSQLQTVDQELFDRLQAALAQLTRIPDRE